MKKLKLIMVLLLSAVTFGASAQFTNMGGTSSNRTNGMSSDISITYQGDFGVGVFAGDATTLTVGMTHGAKITDYFFAGVGIWGEVSTDNWEWWNIAPMLSLKGYYPITEKCRVFVNPELGVTIGVAGEVGSGFYTFKNEGSHFEYRLTGGLEMNKFFFGLGCGGAGKTAFFAKLGFLF